MKYQLDVHGEMLMDCYVYVLKQGGGPAGLCRIFDLLNGNQPSNMTIAKELSEQAQKLSFE